MKKLTNKLFIVFIFSFFSINAFAVEVKVNCENIKLSLNTTDKNNLRFGAYWKEVSKFPKPPITRSIGNIEDGKNIDFNFDCPNLSVIRTKNVIQIQSDNYENLLKLINDYDQNLDLYHYGFYAYPNIKQDWMVLSYKINLKTFDLKTSIYTSKEGVDLDDSISFTDAVPRETIIGYKVDGGELKPLLYDRKVSFYKKDFENANIIDIYHKMPKDKFGIGANIERIYIDKNNGLLKIFKKNPFPDK